MQEEIERRHSPLSMQKREDGSQRLIGYASTFSMAYPVDMVQEIIHPSAFTRTLQEQPDVFAFMGHDDSRVLGRTKNGTLSLAVDAIGLRVEISPMDTQDSRDAFTLVASGAIDSMSFGFSVVKQMFNYEASQVIRTIMDVALYEVSLVAFPANPATTLSLRNRNLASEAIALATLRRKAFLPPPPLAILRKGIN